jgi:hypothetical protein
MTSRELYRELRAELGGWFREQGFRSARQAQLGWNRASLFVWFQCDKWGWDRYAGSSFFVNIQVEGEPRPWSGPTRRLQELLDDDGLDEARSLQNEAIRRLKWPPGDYLATMRQAFGRYPDGEAMFDALLASFKPIEEPFRRDRDVAFRYFDSADVAKWSKLLLRVFPDALLRAEGSTGGRTRG